jgi:hypothetical protein
MGQSGVDVVLSPAAKKLLPLCIECKNVEALNCVGVFQAHLAKYKDHPGLKLLIHKRNRTSTMVTLEWADLLQLLEGKLRFQHLLKTQSGSTSEPSGR